MSVQLVEDEEAKTSGLLHETLLTKIHSGHIGREFGRIEFLLFLLLRRLLQVTEVTGNLTGSRHLSTAESRPPLGTCYSLGSLLPSRDRSKPAIDPVSVLQGYQEVCLPPISYSDAPASRPGFYNHNEASCLCGGSACELGNACRPTRIFFLYLVKLVSTLNLVLIPSESHEVRF